MDFNVGVLLIDKQLAGHGQRLINSLEPVMANTRLDRIKSMVFVLLLITLQVYLSYQKVVLIIS